MIKSEKEELIQELNGKFSKATTAIVAEFGKLNVDTVTRLRKKLRDEGIEYKVLKNTLAKRAAKGTKVEVVSDDFTGPVAAILGYGDVVTPAKVLSDFIKDLETIKVRSAMVEGQRIDAAGVTRLAKMPGLNELRAQLMGMLTQPATKLVRTVAAPGSQLARVLQAHVDKSNPQ
jgi:large subunit ribosomal protein L10